MKCAIDQSAPSTDRAALSMDQSLAQQSIDRTAPSVDWLGQTVSKTTNLP